MGLLQDLAAEFAGAGLPRVAASFLNLCIVLDPGCPGHALQAGVIAADRAQYGLAWRWLGSAAASTRGRGPRTVYVASLIAMGELASKQELHEVARRIVLVAVHHAEKAMMPNSAGDAWLSLARIRRAAGHTTTCVTYLHRAIAAYKKGNAGAVAVASELSSLCLAEGDVWLALRVHRLLVQCPCAPAEHTVLGGARLARAVAALGWETCFEELWNVAFASLERCPATTRAAALLELACGAGILRMWYRAQVAAQAGLHWAGRARSPSLKGELGRVLLVTTGVVDPTLAGVVFRATTPDLLGFSGAEPERPSGEALRAAADSVERALRLIRAQSSSLA